jgi:hypothetical protein
MNCFEQTPGHPLGLLCTNLLIIAFFLTNHHLSNIFISVADTAYTDTPQAKK